MANDPIPRTDKLLTRILLELYAIPYQITVVGHQLCLMSKIRKLPDNLANQIAAGEVVERPASVIKELVENSIDAGATRIDVEIELGGRRLMRVSDDGEGMVRDDAILAFERHSTSKITALEDLDGIRTLGFRGEALASIASVAKVELLSKVKDDETASRIVLEGGELVDSKAAARPTGTTIAVKELFFNTPARRKFMRSQATENYHITNTVTHYALANPGISFSLLNNGRESIRVSPARDVRERAYQLFGANVVESLLPVRGGREFVANITGFVSAPRERRTTRDSQYFFINGRFVKDKIISGGLLEGFRSVLPHGVYPVAFLFLDVPPEEIDVNVHPAKTEVRFRRAEAVKYAIAEAVRESLGRAGILENSLKPEDDIDEAFDPEVRADENPSGGPDHQERVPTKGVDIPVNSGSQAAARLQREEQQEEIGFGIPAHASDSEIRSTEPAEERGFATPPVADAASPFRNTENAPSLPPVDSATKIADAVEVEDVAADKIQPLGQLHDSFIVAADDKGLLLIDQHVAHERILFDKFRRRESDRQLESQNLLLPETIDLTPAQATAFDEVSAELEESGFGLLELSGRTIAINSVPTDLPTSEVRNLVMEILDTVEKDKKGGAKRTLRDEIAASMACKAAVKINMKLTPEKMRWMIDGLLSTSSPTTCPHGRPVILRLTMEDIERKFHRT